VTESRDVSAIELHVRLSFRCWFNRSQGQSFPGVNISQHQSTYWLL